MAEDRKLAGVVKSVLKDVMGASFIGDVHVVRTVDHDDDDILRIYVEFKGTIEQFDAKRANTVIRHMRPRLSEELAEEAFPVISYVSGSDMKTVRDAVA